MTNTPPLISQAKVKVAGTELSLTLTEALEYIEVDSSMYHPSAFTLRFNDKDDLAIINGTTFDLGKEVEIQFTDPTQGSPPFTTAFKGEITAIEPEFGIGNAVSLVIRGYDKRHRLTRHTTIKSFTDVSDSDIIQQVAQGAGLSVTVDSTTVIHKQVIQDNVSDLEFIYHRAWRIGLELFFDPSTSQFKARAYGISSAPAAGTITWGVDMRSFHPRKSLADQVSKVTVNAWDPVQKALVSGEATSASNMVQPSGTSGASAISSKISAQERTYTFPRLADANEATKIAQSLLDLHSSTYIEAEAVTIGDPSLIAGKKVTIASVGTAYNGDYLITGAVHHYSGTDGYLCHLRLEGNRLHLMSDYITGLSDSHRKHWGGVYPAVITDNDKTADSNAPNWGNMVKVKFPWLKDAMASYWARVIAPDAGPNRGTIWIPEIGDEVLVAFEDSDFNFPYVIGGLWNGQADMPDTVANLVKDGKVENRVIKTRTGHKITLSDDANSGDYIEIIDRESKISLKLDTKNKLLTLKTEKGKLEISNDNGKTDLDVQGAMTLKNTSEALTIESGSGAITIKTSGAVNVESSGGNVTIKGTGGVKIESSATVDIKGNAPVTVESSAILNLKGSLVNIG
jgi:phage protein D/phage baseplate assembly protein gpV